MIVNGEQAPATVDHTVLPELAEVDRLLFGGQDPYQLSPKEQEELRVALVRSASERHLEMSPAYARFARDAGFSPDELEVSADLAHVPQVPTGVFKRSVLASVPPGQVAKRCTSSGTQGQLSVVLRDRTTLERLLGSVQVATRLIAEWFEDDVTIINLGPNAEEAGDLWFSYVMSLLELLYPTRHAISRGLFDVEASTTLVARALDQSPVVGLVGPPALIAQIAHSSRGTAVIRGLERLHVVTAGGWKRANDVQVDRKMFTELVGEAFALHAESQIRDAFNQVELNTVMVECEHHRMHVPPWLDVIVREPCQLLPLPLGEEGLLSYLDPTATSYPAFIVGDDLGVLSNTECPCGRIGRWVRIIRRLERREQWGCALKLSSQHLAGPLREGVPA